MHEPLRYTEETQEPVSEKPLLRYREVRIIMKGILGLPNPIPTEPRSQIFSPAGAFMASSVRLLGKECSQAPCISTSLKAQETVNKKGMTVLRLPPLLCVLKATEQSG